MLTCVVSTSTDVGSGLGATPAEQSPSNMVGIQETGGNDASMVVVGE